MVVGIPPQLHGCVRVKGWAGRGGGVGSDGGDEKEYSVTSGKTNTAARHDFGGWGGGVWGDWEFAVGDRFRGGLVRGSPSEIEGECVCVCAGVTQFACNLN